MLGVFLGLNLKGFLYVTTIIKRQNVMKPNKFKRSNIIFFIIIILLIIPQTRETFQVWMHKGFSFVNQSSLIKKEDRKVVSSTNWELLSHTNTHLNFENTRGKVVFINFWATWCPPCIAEMPSIQDLYNDYKDNVVFMFVTHDDFETVEKFKTKRGFNFEVFTPLNESPSELQTRAIPRTFIINKQGEIVVDESGAVDWNSNKVRRQLDELLAE